MRRTGLFLLMLLFIGPWFNPGAGQSDSLNEFKQPRLLLGLSVPHAFFNGMKLEALLPLGEKLYLYASPELYNGRLTYTDRGRLSGFGLHTGLRYAYWQNERKGAGVMAFVQSDLEYNFFKVNLRDEYWIEREENGQTVSVLEEGDVYKKFNRLGFNYRMGGLWYFPSGFYYEWSFGVAVRRSFMSTSDNYFPEYKNDRLPWGFGYTGITPLFGLRFGFLIR